VAAVSIHLEIALGPEYRYRSGPPFVYQGDVTVSVHLVDAKGLLDDVAVSGSPTELDRLADTLRAAAAHGRAEQPNGRTGQLGGTCTPSSLLDTWGDEAVARRLARGDPPWLDADAERLLPGTNPSGGTNPGGGQGADDEGER
jgi:hypothetical protein